MISFIFYILHHSNNKCYFIICIFPIPGFSFLQCRWVLCINFSFHKIFGLLHFCRINFYVFVLNELNERMEIWTFEIHKLEEETSLYTKRLMSQRNLLWSNEKQIKVLIVGKIVSSQPHLYTGCFTSAVADDISVQINIWKKFSWIISTKNNLKILSNISSAQQKKNKGRFRFFKWDTLYSVAFFNFPNLSNVWFFKTLRT